MPKKLNRQGVKSEVNRMAAFVMGLADEKDVEVKQDDQGNIRMWVEGKEVFGND